MTVAGEVVLCESVDCVRGSLKHVDTRDNISGRACSF